jgi:hypothetical protein
MYWRAPFAALAIVAAIADETAAGELNDGPKPRIEFTFAW